jgi:hypothetical protein
LSTEATSPCTEAMLTMRPQPRARIAGSAAFMAWKAADRLIAMMASQRSAGKLSIAQVCWMPALLTRMSIGPSARVAASTRPAASSARERLACT